MKRIFAVAAIVAAFGSSVVMAAETNATPVAVEKQIRDLKKLVGSGEISSKEYNNRVAELRDGAAQQTAESTKK